MFRKIIFLFFSFVLVGSIAYACEGGGEGGNGGTGDDDNPFSVLIRLAKAIKSGKITFIPKEELEARERRRAEIRKMQAEEEKKADLFRKAGNIFDTSDKIATAINVGAGIGLGLAVPGAAGMAAGFAYTAASAKASGGSVTKSLLRAGAIEVAFPTAHAVVKAAIDYTASNVDFNSKAKSDTNTNTNVYNSKAYQDAMATHSQPGISMRYGGM